MVDVPKGDIERIKRYLSERPRNTAEILEHVNSTSLRGIIIEDLHTVLDENEDIVNVGFIKRSGILSGGYKLCEWATQQWIDENYDREELTSRGVSNKVKKKYENC